MNMKRANDLHMKNLEKKTDHLINPREFQMMDINEKIYNNMSRHNKQSADLINRITVMKKKAAEK